MIIEMLNSKENFTNSEDKIAEYILKNPFEIGNLTAVELGENTYTSKSSIFRLCKKLGVDSYDEFKRKIEIEMNEKTRLNSLLTEEPFDKNSSLKDITTILPSFYDTAINNTRLCLDLDKIKKIVRTLNESDKIDIYGSGITMACAEATKFKFLSIGKDCSVCTAINEHYLMATKNKKNVAIILSFTGENAGMVYIAKYLKELGVYTIAISGNSTGLLKKECNEFIEVYQKDLVMSLEMLTPYISMTYIMDILFAAMLVKDFDKNLNDAINVIQHKTGTSEEK